MANAAALLSTQPNIEKVDLLAAKFPGQAWGAASADEA
jgi:hypothetical protein